MWHSFAFNTKLKGPFTKSKRATVTRKFHCSGSSSKSYRIGLLYTAVNQHSPFSSGKNRQILATGSLSLLCTGSTSAAIRMHLYFQSQESAGSCPWNPCMQVSTVFPALYYSCSIWSQNMTVQCSRPPEWSCNRPGQRCPPFPLWLLPCPEGCGSY